MRIIAGKHRGRTLSTSGLRGTRPTTDRARETMFNIVGNMIDFSEKRVVDLFAGSGALGLEALSRGARTLCAVEKNRGNAKVLQNNVESLHEEENVHVFTADVLIMLKKPEELLRLHSDEKFDIVFCDPPYSLMISNEVLSLLPHMLADGAIVVMEHDVRETLLIGKDFMRMTFRNFGETMVDFLKYCAEK